MVLCQNQRLQNCSSSMWMTMDEWGQVYTCGLNSRGQLGNDTTSHVPKPVKALATKHIIQVASGQYHYFVLTNSKQLVNSFFFRTALKQYEFFFQLVNCIHGELMLMVN